MITPSLALDAADFGYVSTSDLHFIEHHLLISFVNNTVGLGCVGTWPDLIGQLFVFS